MTAVTPQEPQQNVPTPAYRGIEPPEVKARLDRNQAEFWAALGSMKGRGPAEQLRLAGRLGELCDEWDRVVMEAAA